MKYEINLYAKRDIIKQGNYYSKHVDHMTGEGLHSKSDIAAELAHRDMIIDRLLKLINSVAGDKFSIELIDAEADKQALELSSSAIAASCIFDDPAEVSE